MVVAEMPWAIPPTGWHCKVSRCRAHRFSLGVTTYPAREQHIRREKATSNICTSQALLANMAAMYAVYHGPNGLTSIAKKVHSSTQFLKSAVERLGYRVVNDTFFDTLTIDVSSVCDNAKVVHAAAALKCINLRRIDDTRVGVTFDESVSRDELDSLIDIFSIASSRTGDHLTGIPQPTSPGYPEYLARTSEFLTHPVFNKHHSETEMLRYIFHLSSKDLSLVHAMIPLGSCTMKLNSTSSMIPLTWPQFSNVHPFSPSNQVRGYKQIIEASGWLFIPLSHLHAFQELEADLCRITGFHACSVQPNSGAAGEYAGLTAIRAYHESRGESHRDICLIPVSAHGTNPAVRVLYVLCTAVLLIFLCNSPP